MKSKLEILQDFAPKRALIVNANPHEFDDQSIREYILDLDGVINLPEKVIENMELTNTLITVTFYTDSKFHSIENVHHYCFDLAIEEALRICKNINYGK